MGFKGDILKAGATKSNFWICNTWDSYKTSTWNFMKQKETPHILYVSFPSLKDINHDPGEEMMHTGECVTFVPWGVFE
jgi:all-trans-retinol 13,14-reductase